MSVKNITYGQNHPHSVKATAIGKSPIINQSMIRKNNNNKLKKKKKSQQSTSLVRTFCVKSLPRLFASFGLKLVLSVGCARQLAFSNYKRV